MAHTAVSTNAGDTGEAKSTAVAFHAVDEAVQGKVPKDLRQERRRNPGCLSDVLGREARLAGARKASAGGKGIAHAERENRNHSQHPRRRGLNASHRP
jgi:hypothetical protein